MSQKTTLFLLGGLMAAALLVTGYYKFKPDVVAVNDDEDIQTENTAPMENDAQEKQEPKKDTSPSGNSASGALIKTEKQGSESTAPWNTNAAAVSAPVPDLDRPIVFPGGYFAERATEVTKQINDLTAILKGSNNRFNEWMDLALLRKSIEDYEGARDIWEYVGAIRPKNAISFANLGSLYAYYLGNPLKAEANFLHAVENEPRFLDWYVRTVDFYTEVMGSKGKAVDFLGRSIQKYPEWTELQDLRTHISQ